MIVRATVHRPFLRRDHLATVNVNLPEVQHELRAGWVVPLPKDEQPPIITNPATGQPIIDPKERPA